MASEFIPKPTRAQLALAARGDAALIRAFEALFAGVQFAPEDIQAAVDAAAVATAAAAAAAAAAGAAQADVDALEALPFVLVAASGTVPNERVLAVDPLGLKLTDGGVGGALTIARADLAAVLGADVADSTGAFVNAGALTLGLVANATYLVDALVTFQAAATTTGLALGFTLPAGATISGLFQHNTSALALEGSYNIAAGAVKGNTTGVLVASENVPLQGRWLIKTDATAGAAQLQFRTEVAASAVTLKAGLSALIARRLA